MRIAMISEHASPLATIGGVDAGGQNVYVAALARELARRGHEVDVYTRRDDPARPACVPLAAGVRVVHVPAGPARELPKDDLLPYMPGFGQWLAAAWARGDLPRPDVVHAHFWMSGVAALRARDLLPGPPLPLVQTFHALGSVKRRHQGAADTSPAGRVDAERQLALRSDLVLATCTDEVDELGAMGAGSAAVRVVPCGVDLGTFAADGPDDLPPELAGRVGDVPRGSRLLCVGRLVGRKGVGTVVDALRELPDARLVVAGGPAPEDLEADRDARALRDLAERAGVADRVHVVGRVSRERLPQLIRWSDAVLATPWYEPFGMVPLEAMACGRPVVASAVGGLTDTVVDGETGLLVPPRDAAALAAALGELLPDGERRAVLGKAGAERARERYGWPRVAADVEAAYAEVVRPVAPPRAISATPAWLRDHLAELDEGLAALRRQGALVESWGARLATLLAGGHRLLAAGNGGSAAEAQHLTAELVGRFLDERAPLSAICLNAETSSLTAILNDYGANEVFARQVRAHGRRGDVLVLLSTSGRSENLLAAARAAREVGVRVWSLTGPPGNPLAALSDEALCVPAASTAAVQEVHLIAVHALCAALDAALASGVPLAGVSA